MKFGEIGRMGAELACVSEAGSGVANRHHQVREKREPGCANRGTLCYLLTRRPTGTRDFPGRTGSRFVGGSARPGYGCRKARVLGAAVRTYGKHDRIASQ